jgi:hypothetical protein
LAQFKISFIFIKKINFRHLENLIIKLSTSFWKNFLGKVSHYRIFRYLKKLKVLFIFCCQ